MFPERTELLLIGHSIESTLTQKSKSNTLTPKTNSQTYWPRDIAHVVNGLIFCFCLTSTISVLQIVLKWCRKERKKIQKVKEPQKSRSRWWIWSRDAATRLWCATFYCIRKPGKTRHEVNFLWVRELSSITEQGDLLKTLTHQPTQIGMFTRPFLFKSGNLMNWWKIKQSDLLFFAQQTDRFIVENENMNFHTEAESEVSLKSSHSCKRWVIKCERNRTNLQKMQQKTATNTLWYGE